MIMGKRDKFRFRRLDSIGAAAAEEDPFLEKCFIDTGDLDVLRNCRDARRVVLGRTGSGKSALLLHLCETEGRAIEVKPESLALAYISNSTVLQFFSELGVKLDIFFRLLWRHVFTVEILKCHFHIETEADKQSFLEKLFSRFKDKKRQQAVEYLRQWGQSFWEETEYRIKEVTTTLEDNLQAAARVGIPNLTLSADSARKLTEEQKHDVIHRAQRVVNSVQIRQLSDILELINDVLDDPQQRYYLVIDRLDENWIEDALRYRLIRALIETAKDFSKVQQVKVIVAIRYDLLDRVFRLTRDAGFQEEKYESLYLPIEWSRSKLIEVLDTRISALIEQRYTKQGVTHRDVLPDSIDGDPAIDYMLSRTMMRPRDLILFFNCCIHRAADRPQITVQLIREAEGEYSSRRLRSLADEWATDYPSLLDFISLLRGRPKQFPATGIADEEIMEFCLDLAVDHGRCRGDVLSAIAIQVAEMEALVQDFRKVVLQVFYRVGLIGLKLQIFESITFTSSHRRVVSKSEIADDTRVAIHPSFWRSLGVKP
jgi:hypothetical protein